MSVWVGVGLWLIIELPCSLDCWLFLLATDTHRRTQTSLLAGFARKIQDVALYIGLGVCETGTYVIWFFGD
jgi:hypothetical protein